MKPQILAFAGSTRTDSFNKKLIRIAARRAEEVGAKVTLIDLRDFPLPLYDGDLEEKEGMPPTAQKLKDLFKAHEGFLISAPEYNSSISGVLKNTIDWVSRPAEMPAPAFEGKVAALLSASPGGLGGLRGLVTVRSILENLGTVVLPAQFSLSLAGHAFNPDGSLVDAKKAASVQKIAENLVQFLKKLQT